MLMQDIFAISKLAQLHNSRRLKEYDITGSEHTALGYLAMHQSCNQERIAQYMLLDKGTVARLLASLEKKSLIMRQNNPHNRRENLVSLTAEGATLVGTLAAASETLGNALLKDIPAEEQAIFTSVLSRIRSSAFQAVHSHQPKAHTDE